MEAAPLLWDAAGLLQGIFNYCQGVRENQQLALRVHGRLQDLFSELERHERRGVQLSSDVLGKYMGLLKDFEQFLHRHQRKNVVCRIIMHRKTCERIQVFHEDIDQFFRLFTLSLGAELVDFKQQDAAWKAQFERDVVEQRALYIKLASDSATLLRELNTAQKKREALTVWDLARKDVSSESNIVIDRAYNTLLRYSQGINVQAPESWFIHEAQVDLDEFPIGAGAFGEVFLGYFEEHTRVAVKRLPKADERMRRDFRKEIHTWWGINHHQFVLRMYGACDVSELPFIVCEYAPHGSLDNFLLADSHSIRQLWRLLYEAAQGIAFLHSKKVVHGDIKCNNILVGTGNHARIADFGMSFTRTNSASVSKTQSQTGAVRWKAPECIDGEYPTFASDWFSFGMSVLEAASGRVPWAGVADDSIVRDNVRLGKLPPRPRDLPDDAWDLVVAMCKKEPGDRLVGANALRRMHHTQVRVDDYDEEYIAYVFRCDWKPRDGTESKTWFVPHRFSVFNRLHKDLKKRIPPSLTKLPDFPRKHRISGMFGLKMGDSEEIVEERKMALGSYMVQVLAICASLQDGRTVPELDGFLNVTREVKKHLLHRMTQ
ncbi:hypothetical protein ATCC90586_010853 [Pythium insidiosum]|nr:hypothetical protein ATCC90586_010853 [Pythium insidiosum]